MASQSPIPVLHVARTPWFTMALLYIQMCKGTDTAHKELLNFKAYHSLLFFLQIGHKILSSFVLRGGKMSSLKRNNIRRVLNHTIKRKTKKNTISIKVIFYLIKVILFHVLWGSKNPLSWNLLRCFNLRWAGSDAQKLEEPQNGSYNEKVSMSSNSAVHIHWYFWKKDKDVWKIFFQKKVLLFWKWILKTFFKIQHPLQVSI